MHGRLPTTDNGITSDGYRDRSGVDFQTAIEQVVELSAELANAFPFTVGDVFFAEVLIAYKICSNGARLLELEIDETFHCQLDRSRYFSFVARLQGKR